MKFRNKNVPKWIEQAFEQTPDLWKHDYLIQAIESRAMTELRWGQLHQTIENVEQPSAAALSRLAMRLRYALEEFEPGRQLSAKQRQRLAEKISRKAKVLAAELDTLGVHQDWKDYRLEIRNRMIAKVRELYGHNPVDVVQRRLPEFMEPTLRGGWQEGVHGAVDALPELLRTVATTLDEWSTGHFDGPWVGRPNNLNANRTFFFKVLTEHFSNLYDAPLRKVTLALGEVFFPDAPELDTAQLAEIAPRPQTK